MTQFLMIQMASLGILAIACQWVAWKTRTPAIIYLLLSGFIFGAVFGWLQPKPLLGATLQPFIALAVALILFESSLQLRFREVRAMHGSLLRFVIIGALVGWLLLTLAAYYVAGLSLPVAATFGGLLVVTGPTVIIPILHHAKLKQRVGSMLKWEGIINDPVGVIFAVLAYEYFHFMGQSSDESGFFIHMAFILLLIVAGSVGAGIICSRAFEKGYIPEYLKSPFLIACVLGMYTLCNLAMHESGLIAVTVFGITMANAGVASMEEVRRFKETVSVMLVSGVFLLLTANLDPAVLLELTFPGIAFILLVLLLVRPLTVLIASFGSGWSRQEKVLVGWIAPRGVVCAAVAGIMGPRLVEAGYPDGAHLLPLAFGIVLASVTVHGFTVKPLARFLNLAAEKGHGLLIVGCSTWTVQLAEVLKRRGMRVRIADSDWHRLREARLNDIPVYYGEILSDEAEFEINLNQYDALLSATTDTVYNTLVCSAFAAEYGREHVYQITLEADARHERKQIAHTLRGRVFLKNQLDYVKLVELFHQGWRFRTMRIGSDEKAQKNPYQPSDHRKIAGLIKSDGRLSFSGGKVSVEGKEGDIAILFEKEEAKREQIKEKADGKDSKDKEKKTA